MKALGIILLFRERYKRPWIAGAPQFIGLRQIVERTAYRPIIIAVRPNRDTISILYARLCVHSILAGVCLGTLSWALSQCSILRGALRCGFGVPSSFRGPNRDREGPHGLPPPTLPDLRVTSPAVRWRQSAMGTAMEARQSQAVAGAPRERDRQRWAGGEAPRPLGGLDRVPGQVPAHAAATPLPVALPIPWLPQIAAQLTPDPGVQLREA
jgi:hypothetical protein